MESITGTRRLTTLPIVHKDLWQMYKKAVASFWTAEEIDLAKDADGFKKLNDKQQHFLKHVLAFFAASDGLVNANLMERFYMRLPHRRPQAFTAFKLRWNRFTARSTFPFDRGPLPGRAKRAIRCSKNLPRDKEEGRLGGNVDLGREIPVTSSCGLCMR